MNDSTLVHRIFNPRWMHRVLAGILVAGALAYGIFLARYVSPHAGGSDPSGYLNSARLLSQGKSFAPARPLPGHDAMEFGEYSISPLGFKPGPSDRLAPTYPTGYPLHLMIAAGFGWERATAVANILTALASGFLLFAFCHKLGFNPWLSCCGVALLWSCPLFLYAVLLPMSDLAALCWSLAALYCALGAGSSWRQSFFCGVAAGIAVLVRPTNLLIIVPVLVAIGFRPRSWLAVGWGGLPGAVYFLLYNWRVYGSPLLTGYGDVSIEFKTAYLAQNVAAFTHWIPVLLSPLVILTAVAPLVAVGRQRGLIALLVWFLTLLGFYAFYSHAGETWWYLRFILPAFPALIVAVLAVLETLRRAAPTRPGWALAVIAALLIFAFNWQLKQIRRLDVMHLERGERTYSEAARWAQRNLPTNSVIFCMQVSGAFFYYTDFILFRWDMVDADRMPRLFSVLQQENRPVYAILYEFEEPRALERMGGQWRPVVTIGNATFWQLVSPRSEP